MNPLWKPSVISELAEMLEDDRLAKDKHEELVAAMATLPDRVADHVMNVYGPELRSCAELEFIGDYYMLLEVSNGDWILSYGDTETTYPIGALPDDILGRFFVREA